MVNFTPASSSSPTTSPINQHSGLVTAQANDDGCNDDPPPIPQPSAGNGLTPPYHLPAGGVPISNNDNRPVDVTPPSHRHPSMAAHQHNSGYGVKIYDYGAPGVSTLQRHQQISPSTTATSVGDSSTAPASANSSVTAVELEETAIDIETKGSYDGENPHTTDAQAVAMSLGVTLAMGLRTADARAKLQKDGPNTLTTAGGITWWGVLLRQVSNSLTFVSESPTFLILALCRHVLSSWPDLSALWMRGKWESCPGDTKHPYKVTTLCHAVGSRWRIARFFVELSPGCLFRSTPLHSLILSEKRLIR